MNTNALHVQPFTSFASLAPLASAIDALNHESRSPALASSFAFTRRFAEHDDLVLGRDFELLYLTARQGERLVGYLPLRRRRERFAGVSYGRIEMLVAHDEAGRLVARPEDEGRCAEAFMRHLLEVERDWSLLAFRRQAADSPLLHLPGPGRSLLTRRNPGASAVVIPIDAGSLAEYARSRPRSWRSSVGRNLRSAFGAGEVELLRCTEVTRPGVLLDLYVDLERRSHKARAVPPFDLGHRSQRVAFYRALIDPALGFAASFSFLRLNGRVISGLFAVTFAGVSVWQGLAYDERDKQHGPGALSVLTGIGHAIEQGCRAIDLGYGLEQYKSRWGASVTPTWDVELHKAGSVPFLRALARTVRRRLAARPNSRESGVGARAPSVPAPDEPLPTEAGAGKVEQALAASGAKVERLTGAALGRTLPFSTQ